jgi:hypothetical protein
MILGPLFKAERHDTEYCGAMVSLELEKSRVRISAARCCVCCDSHNMTSYMTGKC